MSTTISESVTLETCVCSECGITFAVPENWRANRKRDHATFYCPNGHNQHYPGKSDVEVLREQLDQQKQEAIRQRDNYFEEQRKHEETQRKLGRLQTRTARGVCPCCKRTVSQLSRHMQSKHPGFLKETGVPIEKPRTEAVIKAK